MDFEKGLTRRQQILLSSAKIGMRFLFLKKEIELHTKKKQNKKSKKEKTRNKRKDAAALRTSQ